VLGNFVDFTVATMGVRKGALHHRSLSLIFSYYVFSRK